MDYFILDGRKYQWLHRMPDAPWRVLRQWVYARDGGKCRYCDIAVELYGCHIHHVLPLSEHGTNHPGNLKTACVECHKKKHPHMQKMLRWS